MAMNTPYLGSSATVPANLNTSYISTGMTEITSALSIWGPVSFLQQAPNFASGLSISALTVSSTATIGGAITATSGISVGAGKFFDGATLNPKAPAFLSGVTTASATSNVLADGAFMFTNLSVTSCTLAFRSGNTTYTFRATAAGL